MVYDATVYTQTPQVRLHIVSLRTFDVFTFLYISHVTDDASMFQGHSIIQNLFAEIKECFFVIARQPFFLCKLFQQQSSSECVRYLGADHCLSPLSRGTCRHMAITQQVHSQGQWLLL